MALEPSQGMVDQAKKKSIYKEFIMEIMGAEPTSIKRGEYGQNLSWEPLQLMESRHFLNQFTFPA